MLTMKTFTRGQVRFEWSDEEVDSVVSLSPQDDQETIVRKLRRVLALAEGEPEPRSAFLASWAGRQAPAGPPPQTGNGWAAMTPPQIPEGADYELIPEDERE